MSGTGEAAGRLASPPGLSASGLSDRRRSGSAGAQEGTTLIETLVVVAITALVALIGLPQMQQSLLTLSQRQAVAVVAARLRLARAQALREDATVVFAAAPDGGGYGVLGGVVTPTPPGVTVSISRESDGGNRRIAFYGDGSASGGVVAVSAGRRTLRVTVSPGAGAVAAQGA
jgi:type II secretory pathway pseudopilin PulG